MSISESSIKGKELERRRLQEQVDEFVSKGGKIQVLSSGDCSVGKQALMEPKKKKVYAAKPKVTRRMSDEEE